MKVSLEKGQVIEILGDKAKIKIKRSPACESCQASGVCKMLSSEYMVFEVQNPLRAKVGQEVIVSIPTEKELKAALIVYIIPLINFILGAIFGYYLNIFNNRDLSAIFISILFLVLTFLGIKLYSKKYEKTPFLKPAIKQVINGTNQEQIKI